MNTNPPEPPEINQDFFEKEMQKILDRMKKGDKINEKDMLPYLLMGMGMDKPRYPSVEEQLVDIRKSLQDIAGCLIQMAEWQKIRMKAMGYVKEK